MLAACRYMLGDGPRSFVVGYGKRPPQRPHHRGASCPPAPRDVNKTRILSLDATSLSVPAACRYMLGDGPRSFVVGYGKRPPQRPHHRAASCPPLPAACNHSALHSSGANPHELTGALVGGPSLQDTYADDRGDYVTSEVTPASCVRGPHIHMLVTSLQSCRCACG